jgi:hypothetical protein
MNYIELINRYWQEVDVKGFTPTETNIYFRLLDICNRLGWINPFSLSNPRAVALMAVTENTLAAGRDKLVMKGLIGFKRGSRRKDIPMYCFPEKIDGEWFFPNGFTSCFASNIEPKHEVKSGAKPAAKSMVKPAAYNKTKTETENIISHGGESPRARAPVPDGLFSERELSNMVPKGIKAAKLAEFSPPSVEEVKDYFLLQRANLRLPDWETEALSFFSYYDSQGWVKSNGRKVSNWESLVNDWILRKEREQKQPKHNEQTTNYRRTTPEDALADEQEKLARRILARRNSQTTPRGAEGDSDFPFGG